ncbi:MAG: dCMP deaminase family protein [Flavobacteriales bacterium]|nr:dCMP deaminase family protein [Flavobacteriales bacterium]MDG1440030.1 dCMP deaminase family protein [Flavobacteriales bacterium]
MIDKQLRYDLAYLKMALEWGKLSHCTRKKVGAIIVKNRMIISDGFNGAPTGFNNDCEDEKGETNWFVLHAEANAILKVAKSTNSCDQATLYLTLSPCKECAKLIHQSGIKRLVYLKKYKDTTGLNFLIKAGVIIEQINFEDFEK